MSLAKPAINWSHVTGKRHAKPLIAFPDYFLLRGRRLVERLSDCDRNPLLWRWGSPLVTRLELANLGLIAEVPRPGLKLWGESGHRKCGIKFN
jgi:hypothetical protein